MTSSRGSKHKLTMIKESTFGVTPATPALLEVPVNTFVPTINNTLIRSDQIRTHPFTDRLLQGAQVNDITITNELQKTNLDLLLELMAGQAWSTGATKLVDVLESATIESQHIDTSLYDVYTGCCVKQAQFNFPAAADAKVTVQFDLMAKGAVLDNAAAITGETITAASNVDPFVFLEAGVTVGGSAVPTTACAFTVTRQIDPLYLLGARQPDEYIPSTVGLTGQLTVPLRDNTMSGYLTGFTAEAFVISATHPSSGGSFTFTIPAAYFGKAGRPVQNRGVILQTFDWEARYDSGTSTVMSLAKT